jgi:predicted kinase
MDSDDKGWSDFYKTGEHALGPLARLFGKAVKKRLKKRKERIKEESVIYLANKWARKEVNENSSTQELAASVKKKFIDPFVSNKKIFKEAQFKYKKGDWYDAVRQIAIAYQQTFYPIGSDVSELTQAMERASAIYKAHMAHFANYVAQGGRLPKLASAQVIVGNAIYVQAAAPKMYIMRGVSGSGKSTKAKSLAGPESIFSTDDFFTSDSGEYDFDMDKIQEAHEWNQGRVRDAVEEGMDPVVVDNTTVQAWEAKPYVEMAQDAGYDVEVVEADSPWWKSFGPNMSEEELQGLAETLAAKNTHGVDEEIILKMLNKWEHDLTTDQILQSSKPESS